MRVVISQLRKSSADPKLPMMLHAGYPVAEHAGEMFTSQPGYEIAAVYFVDDTARVGEVVAEVQPCGQCAKSRNDHAGEDHEWEAW